MAPKQTSGNQRSDSLSSEINDAAPTSKATPSKAAPSRSEIENALSGKTPRSKKRAVSPASTTLDLNVPPRRQQVIGGKLTGVSNRPKFGIFSRYSDIGIMNWVACGIVILILAAFFWPQENNSTQEVIGSGVSLTPQLGETDLSEDEQNEFLETETTANPLSFSRDDDIGRAGDYRKQDAEDLEIRTLLEKAATELENGNYTQPLNSNAADTYKEVLAINPKNIKAKHGLDAIVTRFLTSGYNALDKDNRAAAESSLSNLGLIEQNSDEYLELETALKAWETKRRIAILLDSAKTAFDKQALILPAKRNALYYYQQVLILDPGNKEAKGGVQNVADTYVQQASDAVLTGQYEAAYAHLATVSIIDPNHSSIPLVEAMITRAKPLAEKALAAQQEELAAQQEQLEAEQQEAARKLEELDAQAQTNSADDARQVADTDTPETDLNPTTEAGNSSEIASAPDTETTSENNTTDTRTPREQTSEQQAFDRQYLKQGLEAYYKGEYDTAAALLQPLADKGISRAQFRLAYMHYLGRGFKRNRTVADLIIRAALPAIQRFAEDGRAWAQSDLGSLYEDGLVLPRNYTDAVYWYRSAAEQGYPGAQTNLGIMYARGRGVTASRRSAIEWFQRAAKQGDSVAQRNLETMGVTN